MFARAGDATGGGKRRKNPLVPALGLVTAAILARGVWAMRRGRGAESARMMSWRIYGQGATVGTMIASVFVVDRLGTDRAPTWIPAWLGGPPAGADAGAGGGGDGGGDGGAPAPA